MNNSDCLCYNDPFGLLLLLEIEKFKLKKLT